MRRLKLCLFFALALLTVLWLLAEPTLLQTPSFYELRKPMRQLSGVLAMACMSLALLLILRARWPEPWFDGLDKMYRLHKWFGIAALVSAVLHWLWAKGPKWAVGLGWIEKPARGAGGGRGAGGALQGSSQWANEFLTSLHPAAKLVGEWTFYVAVILIVLALSKRFPYHLFHRTHRWLAPVYALLVFHGLVLMKTAYWSTSLGWLMLALMVGGLWAALLAWRGRIGARRQHAGTITALHYYPGVKSLEIEARVPGWPGHQAGQFAFALSDAGEGAHPYTIASRWDAADPVLRCVIKELGDHTARLNQRLRVGQPVRVEGPYGCFTFADQQPRQIWIGGGIGITPFIAAMQQRSAAMAGAAAHLLAGKEIDLFHSTAEVDEDALAKLETAAAAAAVRLHVLVDARDGRLSGERIRALVPDWQTASIWFCGPAAFGAALRADFAANGFDVNRHFHQEMFAMR